MDAHLSATRAAYDTVAVDYAEQLSDQLASKPADREALARFATLVEGAVLDVGCGPGHVTHHLQQLGLDVSGIDLSPAMVGVARGAYPGIRFDVGSMLRLPPGKLGESSPAARLATAAPAHRGAARAGGFRGAGGHRARAGCHRVRTPGLPARTKRAGSRVTAGPLSQDVI